MKMDRSREYRRPEGRTKDGGWGPAFRPAAGGLYPTIFSILIKSAPGRAVASYSLDLHKGGRGQRNGLQARPSGRRWATSCQPHPHSLPSALSGAQLGPLLDELNEVLAA